MYLIKHTLGTTVFKDNAFTGCEFYSCTLNRYVMKERTAKTRLITLQEIFSLGCGRDSNTTCPIWYIIT